MDNKILGGRKVMLIYLQMIETDDDNLLYIYRRKKSFWDIIKNLFEKGLFDNAYLSADDRI